MNLFDLTILGYIGPGLGAGAIAVILGVIASIFVGLFAILWYPFKRLFKKLRSGKTKEDSAEDVG